MSELKKGQEKRELKKGQTFFEFVWERYRWYFAIVVLFVVIVCVWGGVLLCVDVDAFKKELLSFSLLFSVSVVAANLLLAIVSIRGRWIDSFPKFMHVIFMREGVELKEFGTNGSPIPVVCEADVRSLAQQFGKSNNNDKNLPLKVEYDVQYEVDMKNRQKMYTVTMWLRPPEPEDTSDMKRTRSNVEFFSPDLGGKVGIEIKSEVRISPEAAS